MLYGKSWKLIVSQDQAKLHRFMSIRVGVMSIPVQKEALLLAHEEDFLLVQEKYICLVQREYLLREQEEEILFVQEST